MVFHAVGEDLLFGVTPLLSLSMQALFDIIALWGSIIVTAIAFFPVNKIAALLLLPHFGWVSFTTVLNFAFLALNGSRGKGDGGNKLGANVTGKKN